VGCYIWYSEEGTGRGRSPPSRLLVVPNVLVHRDPSTASVPITVLLYNGPLLCGFNIPIKGLNYGKRRLLDSLGDRPLYSLRWERRRRIALSELSDFKSDVQSNPIQSAVSCVAIGTCRLPSLRPRITHWRRVRTTATSISATTTHHAVYPRPSRVLQLFSAGVYSCSGFPVDVAVLQPPLVFARDWPAYTGTILSVSHRSSTTLARRAPCRWATTEAPRRLMLLLTVTVN